MTAAFATTVHKPIALLPLLNNKIQKILKQKSLRGKDSLESFRLASLQHLSAVHLVTYFIGIALK